MTRHLVFFPILAGYELILHAHIPLTNHGSSIASRACPIFYDVGQGILDSCYRAHKNRPYFGNLVRAKNSACTLNKLKTIFL